MHTTSYQPNPNLRTPTTLTCESAEPICSLRSCTLWQSTNADAEPWTGTEGRFADSSLRPIRQSMQGLSLPHLLADGLELPVQFSFRAPSSAEL